jgi:DNA-binding MarR family transcriptional regulator
MGREPESQGPSAVAPVQSVGFALSTVGFAVASGFRQTLAPLDLEPRDFALMRGVGAAEGDSQHAIGERLGIPASRMVAFLDALEARGLVERRRNPDDRRTRALYLTAAGTDLLGEAFILAADYERRLCADLPEAEREQLLAVLRRIADGIGLKPGVHAANTHPPLAEV